MKLVISEKQLSKLVSQLEVDQDINEQGEGEGAPETGASSDGEKKTGAAVWTTGMVRGKANPIGLTTWESGVTRGKANPLWEQLSGDNQTAGSDYFDSVSAQNRENIEGALNKRVEILRPDGKVMYAPSETKIVGKFTSDAMDGSKFRNSLMSLISKENGGLGNAQTQQWIPSDWSKIIKLNSVSTFITPDNIKYQAVFRHPVLQQLAKNDPSARSFYATSPQPSGWKFTGYYTDGSTTPFVGIQFEKGFWEEWKHWILAGASIIAAIAIPGIGGLIVSIGIDLFSAALQYAEGDTIGSGISVILAFIPVIGRAIPALKVPKEVAENLAKGLAPLKTEAEIIDFVEDLSKAGLQQERYFLQKLLAEDPKKLVGLIEKELLGSVTQQNAADVVAKLNQLIKNKVLDKVKAEKWYKSLGLKRFGFDFGVSGIIALGGGVLKYYLAKAQQIEALNIPVDEKQVEIANLLGEIYEKNPEDFDNKIAPAIDKYSSYSEGTEEEIDKLNRIQLAVIKAYSENPNQDLIKIADNANK